MSTALLAFALLIGLGVMSFLIALGLASLGLVLSWIFPLTPFQGTLVHLVLLVLGPDFCRGDLPRRAHQRYLLDRIGRGGRDFKRAGGFAAAQSQQIRLSRIPPHAP